MSVRNLALLGVGLTLAAAILFSATLYASRLEKVARQLDGMGSYFMRLGCGELVSVSPPTRTPVVGESFDVKIVLQNAEESDCVTEISLSAAGFTKDPEGPREIAIKPGKTRVIYWTLAAKEPGTHAIVVNGPDHSFRRGIHVLTNQWLSASTASLLSAVLFVLGPMATLPWWIEFFRKKKEPTK